jgi:hypothetical protein
VFSGGRLYKTMEFSGDILLSGNAEVNFVNHFEFDSKWFVYSDAESDFESFWNIGEGEQYWYRVEGYCKKINCVDMGVEIIDDKCEAEYLFLTVVTARNLKELCQILKKPTLTTPVKIKINSVKRYSRPLVKNEEKIDDCNFLIEQKICQIPECFDFCILEDIEVQIGFSSSVTIIFRHTPSGSLFLSSYFDAYRGWHKEFESEDTILNLFGSSDYDMIKFNHEAEGFIVVNGESEYLANRYVYDLDAKEIFINGSVSALSPSFNYVTQGGFLIKGGLSKIKSNFSFSGSLQLNGQADCLFSYNAYGEINIFSINEVLSPNYTYRPTGSISLFGDAYVNVNNEGLFLFAASLRTRASKIDVEFSNSIQSQNLSINNQIISTPCACTDLPLFLILNHNLLKTNTLTQFLDRNSFSLDKDLSIRYKSKNNSWNFNKHFNGVGPDGNLQENWLILFELSCREDLSDYYWNFLMYAKRSLSNNEDFETKIILSVPNSFTCINNSFDLNLKYNTQLNEFYVNNNLLISTINYDEIGLFKNKYWTANPNFVIKIGPQRTYRVDPTIDIKPIFTL